MIATPLKPRSPEAKAAMAAFKAKQCQFVYDQGGDQCTNVATVFTSTGRWCQAHRPKGKKRATLNGIQIVDQEEPS